MPSRPNIVLCMCDQLRPFDVGCYGAEHIHTPHIDRLASEGVRFELAVSNNPVCTPTRCSVLAGQYSRTCTGSVGNTNEQWPDPERKWMPDPLLPEQLREAGYATQLIGKWHIWADPLACGFDHAVYDNIIHRHYGQQYRDDRGEPFVVEEFGPDFEGRRLDAFLAERGGMDQPFFLFHNISQPHMPVGEGNTPQRYLDMYDRDELPLRPNVFVDGEMAHDPEWFHMYRDPDYWYRKYKGGPFYDNDKAPPDYTLRDLTRDYCALVTVCDDQVGRLMAGLRANGLDDNTVVVFMADHGDNLGSHGKFNKGELIEESVRIPMIFWQPGQLAPAVNSEQVAQVIDVMPTLLSLVGVGGFDHAQGRNLSPVLRGEQAVVQPNRAFVETISRKVGVRTPTHTYGMAVDGQGGITDESLLFFDNMADPLQQHNMAKTGEQGELAEELRAAVTDWHEATPWMERGWSITAKDSR